MNLYPCSTSSFNLDKLGWGDSLSFQCLWCSKLSITGDTAKYLGFTLSRGGALSPQDSTCIETRLFRSNLWDHHGSVPSYHHYHLLSIWLSSCNLVGQGRAHMPCGCTGSFSTLNISNLFVPGWPSTSVIHRVNHRHGPCVTTQHKPYQSIPPRCFINISCFLS